MTAVPSPRARVMIVDDDDMVRAACAALLADWGYDVVQARNGIEALDLLEKSPIDGMLLDVNMPCMRGDQLLEVLAGQGRVPPVLVISSEGTETEAKVRKLGARGFLAKPFAIVRLHAELACLVG